MRYLIATLRDDELPPGGWRLVPFRRGESAHSFLLTRHRGKIYAWLNLCPHWSLPLGTDPEQIVTRRPRGLRCDTHDARFRLEDGECFWGPCMGEALEPVPFSVAMGRLFFYLPYALRGEGEGHRRGLPA